MEVRRTMRKLDTDGMPLAAHVDSGELTVGRKYDVELADKSDVRVSFTGMFLGVFGGMAHFLPSQDHSIVVTPFIAACISVEEVVT